MQAVTTSQPLAEAVLSIIILAKVLLGLLVDDVTVPHASPLEDVCGVESSV